MLTLSLVCLFRTVLEKMGLLGEVEPRQAKKKWDNLKKKYKVGADLNDDAEIDLHLFQPFQINAHFAASC